MEYRNMRRSILGWAAAAWIAIGCRGVAAADPLEIEDAIQEGANSLLAGAATWNQTNGDQGLRALCALALVKAHRPVETPAIANVVESILARCTVEDGYKPNTAHHYYSAGVEATLLVEVGEQLGQPQMYRDQIQMIANYIIYGQRQNGSWDYPDAHGAQSDGDTSVTQYAMLGLWAATRAGIPIPNTIFERCVNWQIDGQMADGGFVYCPGTNIGPDVGVSTLNMTAAGIGSILIAARHLYPNQADQLFAGTVRNEDSPDAASVEDANAGGPLEAVELDEAPEEVAPETSTSVPITTIQSSVQRAAGWLGTRFVDYNPAPHAAYYYYTVERAASLAGISHIGPHDWYQFCGDYLLRTQKEDGSWSMSAGTTYQDTSFAILFLALSTGQIVKPPVTPNAPDMAGTGSQDGGRGLPDDLTNVEIVDGKPVVPENLGATSDLLSALENIDNVSFAEVQEQLVEEIQIGDRESLIAQKDRLALLAANDKAEVRRTAIWALGRTGDMSLAKLLITALEDPDVGVNVEANNALCWLSRRPNGFSLATDPLGGLPPGAGQEQIDAVMAAWRADAIQQWGTWYLRHRPFADRGDEFEANLRQRLGR